MMILWFAKGASFASESLAFTPRKAIFWKVKHGLLEGETYMFGRNVSVEEG